jgi:predicted Zn-dependent protease
MPRQTNTYFTAGDKTLDELVALCGDGYIAEHAHGGMEDPKGMGLTAGTEYLEEIKDGKRTGRLFLGPQGGHVELSDPVPRLLSSIIAKSTISGEAAENEPGDPVNKWGGCGKYHKEGVEAGCGGPWILWKGITCG